MGAKSKSLHAEVRALDALVTLVTFVTLLSLGSLGSLPSHSKPFQAIPSHSKLIFAHRRGSENLRDVNSPMASRHHGIMAPDHSR